MAEKQIAFTAIPESKIDSISVLPLDFEIRKMIRQERIPPTKEKITTHHIECKNGIEFPSTIAMEANKEQPAVIPIRPGSTMGLRKSPCARAPDHAREPPTKIPSKIRGIRISKNTFDSIDSNVKSSSHWICIAPKLEESNADRIAKSIERKTKLRLVIRFVSTSHLMSLKLVVILDRSLIEVSRPLG